MCCSTDRPLTTTDHKEIDMADTEDSALPSIDGKLAKAAVDATFQISSLLNMLRRESAHENDGSDFDDVVVSTTKRLHELNNLVMSVLSNDAGIHIDGLREVIEG
jgi:hypothetical protein